MKSPLLQFLEEVKNSGDYKIERVYDEVSRDLIKLIDYEGLSRKEVATKLNISDAALSKKLAGANLTLKSLAEIANVLGYRIGVQFRKDEVHSFEQPWESIFNEYLKYDTGKVVKISSFRKAKNQSNFNAHAVDEYEGIWREAVNA